MTSGNPPANEYQPPAIHSAMHYVPEVIPASVRGSAEDPPGEIAQRILTLPYKCAPDKKQNQKKYKSELLRLLHNTPPVREPYIRSSRRWTGSQLEDQIKKTIANIESALIQIVGRNPPVVCQSCLREKGPWARCIIFEGAGNLVTACGNCHWSKQDHRCSFYVAPENPQTHTRSASLQKQIDREKDLVKQQVEDKLKLLQSTLSEAQFANENRTAELQARSYQQHRVQNEALIAANMPGLPAFQTLPPDQVSALLERMRQIIQDIRATTLSRTS